MSMSFEQIHTQSTGQVTDDEAFLQTSHARAGKHWRVKVGIAGSVFLLGAGAIGVLSPSRLTSSGASKSIVSLAEKKYDKYTSPYYNHQGKCPEGEDVLSKEDCKAAGDVLGYGSNMRDEEASEPVCLRGLGSVGVRWRDALDNQVNICKKKPEDMTDFAALQENDRRMTFHCLEEAAGDFGAFTECMMNVRDWNLDRAWTEEDLKEQQKAAAENAIKEKEKQTDAEISCWTTHTGKVAGKMETGFSAYGTPVLSAKMRCKQMGDRCTAVSCERRGQSSGEKVDYCSVKGPGDDELADQPQSSTVYVVYTPCAEGEEEEEEEAQEAAAEAFSEGSITGEYSRTTYYTEADVQKACSDADDCKGYWKQTPSGKFFILSSGSRKWEKGIPNWTVESVKVKN